MLRWLLASCLLGLTLADTQVRTTFSIYMKMTNISWSIANWLHMIQLSFFIKIEFLTSKQHERIKRQDKHQKTMFNLTELFLHLVCVLVAELWVVLRHQWRQWAGLHAGDRLHRDQHNPLLHGRWGRLWRRRNPRGLWRGRYTSNKGNYQVSNWIIRIITGD